MWSRFTGKSDSGSSTPKKEDDEGRRRRSDTARSKRDRDSDMRSVVSSASTRKPSTRRTDSTPSTIASYATAFDDMPRSRVPNNDDPYDDPRDERMSRRGDGRDRRSSYAESSVSAARDGKERKKERERSSKDSKKSEKRRSTRSDRSSVSQSQAGGYRGDIVEEPRALNRSSSAQIGSEAFSQFPGQVGAPMMSGALPAGSTPQSQYPASPNMSSHVQDQFPGQDPVQYSSSAMPGHNPFGAAADFYYDQGQSVGNQPGVRPQPPSVIIGQDTPHLMAASAQANPVADTGAGSAADFYGDGSNPPASSSKPPRPTSMPGAFVDDNVAPQTPPQPSGSKPSKTNSFPTTAAGLAGGAALGYAMGHSSSNTQHSTSYSTSNVHHNTSYSGTHPNDTYNNTTPAGPSGPSSVYHQGDLPSTTAVNGSYSNIPAYQEATAEAPPPKPPRPGKPEKQPSSSNAGLYAAGAAGLAAYALHSHNSHNASDHAHHTHMHTHNHTHSMPGAFPGHGFNGAGPSPSPFTSGGMAHQHQHTGPVSRFVDWWKDHEDVQKMEEYTEYIGVCRYCFDPRSSVMDAPRKHHYYDRRRRSDEYDRPSGGIDKKSRYGLKEKTSRTSLYSSGDDKRRKSSSSGAGWLVAGLGGMGLATAGKALFTSGRNDFDDTYSIKSGRDSQSRHSRRSRSRESERNKRYSYGSAGIRHRSRSHDRVSIMSTGVTKDKKDYKTVRRHGSRSSSSSRSRDRKSGLGTAIGAGLAGVALGAATRRKNGSRSRSRSAHKVHVQHRRNSSSEDERRRRRSQQLRHKSSRSSASGASFIDISQEHQSQGGFLGGFFAAPPPKEKRVKRSSSTHKKKKKGFFNFGNGSSSSSESDMAFGSGFVRRTKTKRSSHNLKKQSSDERLKATLAGLGATAAAIAVAKANRRNIGKPESEVVAVRERRSRQRSSDRRRPGATSQYGDDEWEDLPDNGTSSSASDGDLVYGDLDLRKTQSRESLNSNGSGTNKWGWRWGFGKKKRRSSDNLYDNIASTSLARPAAAGAIGAAAAAGVAASRLSHHDSESSSQHTLQTVYPVASNDPTSFDARRTSLISTPQALVTTGPGAISLQQPQPMHQVPGSIYSTQPTSQQGYTAPAGPPVFSQVPIPPYPMQAQAQNIIINNHQHSAPPALPRRANSSPIQKSSWKKDVAIAGLAATAGAAAIVAAKGSDSDRPSSAQSNVRFNLTKEQAAKDARERRKEQDRKDEEDDRRRAQQQRDDDLRREEEERRRHEDELRAAEDERRREQLRREDDLRRAEDLRRDEDERRRRELQRQQEEARKFMEVERLAKIETDRLEAERRRQHDEMVARETQEAEDRDCREREARAEAQRRDALEREEEQRRRERREAEAIEAERREAEIRADMDRRRREEDRFDSDRDRRRLDYQPTGSSVNSVATDVRRKEQELQDRERDLVKPDAWKSTAAGAVAAGAVAAITSAAISSHKDKGKEREQRRENWRDTSSSEKEIEPSYQTYKPSKAIEYEPSSVKTYEPSYAQIEPSKIAQDYADEDIFDPNMFKKETTKDVFKDWEDRYTAKPVSQADFFAPKDLLENDNLPKVRPIDPNEGAPDLHVYESLDDYGASQPKGPPYPPSYSFTATRDGHGPPMPDPIPTLNLIQATPPGSRAPSIRSVSMPPSPNIEPVQEKEEPRPKNAPSRVSWGENQFHHFDVPTPESYKEQFISDRELKEHDKKYSQDEVIVEHDSPKSRQKTTTYQPGAESKAPEPKEIAPSTQYVPDRKDESTWDSTESAMSRKSSKKDKKAKKAAAAAAVAAGTAGALTAAAIARNDKDDDPSDWDYKHADNRSTISNPFSDSNAARSTIAASTVSSIPSMGAEYKSPSPYFDYITESETGVPSFSKFKDTTFDERNVTAVPEELHMPGEFIESPSISKFAEPTKKAAEEDDWAAPSSKKSKKGKRKSKNADEEVVTHAISRRVESEPARAPEPPQEEFLRTMSKKEQARREKEAKRMSMMSVQSWEMSDDSRPSSPNLERDIRDMEPTYNAPPPRDLPSASELSSYNWGASDDTQSATSVSTVVPYPRPTPVAQEKKAREVRDEAPVNVTWDKPASGDVSPGSKEITQSRDAPRYGESSSSKATTATLAGGFAALMGASAKQDQDRIAAEREHARQALEAASKYAPRREEPTSPPNGTRSRDDNDKTITIPNYAFEGVEEPSDNKTPRRKLEKRHSSGKWSPTVGSPLRSEMKYDDYLGRAVKYNSPEQTRVEAPKVPTQSAFVPAPEPPASRNIQDSGYYAPDDQQRKQSVERDSDEFFSAGSEEREREKLEKAREQLIENYNAYPPKARSDYDETSTYVTAFSRPDDEAETARSDLIDKHNAYEPFSRSQHDQDDASTFVSAFSRPDDDTSTIIASRNEYDDDDDVRSTVSSRSKYDDDPDREERRRRRREARAAQSGSREQSRDRGYELGDGSERKRRLRRKEADESGYISDTKSTISEARSEANGERRRKHKRRESERDGSTESRIRSRSSAASEPGDLYDAERKSSRRKSKRDDDFEDGASMISASSRRDEDRSSRRKEEKEKEKEKEKRSSGFFGLFSSKSKENLAESSKPSKSKSRDDEDGEDRKHRRRKHRSDRGSTYGSDDDDAKSTISTSSRSHREKRSSRSARGDDRERRDRDDEKVHRSSLR
ncbi:hypothetical protein BU25DRAFT_407055 [Macroventuria anomochaeta]|uniref:Uncharacterized protein n=1 Tax=Macroventuria anomochaeta TaxID=301207 RepID=A0ACB6SB95_9PLEO|nr:uncharacterized protein BU25DRAFT_407055 [Macroventuria anomochaeta]KAF2631406.1 hypothetical protein BU25DRAFT_407055 [Macroventuria anomochaeta]